MFFITQGLLPLIADCGRIILSSDLTRVSAPGWAAYSAVKGAVEVLTAYMAKELGGRGIAVNTVAPGAIETDFFGGAVRDTPEFNEFFVDVTALGRVGLPDDIGPMIANLLSDENRRVNSQRIEVSGGQVAVSRRQDHPGAPHGQNDAVWRRQAAGPLAAAVTPRLVLVVPPSRVAEMQHHAPMRPAAALALPLSMPEPDRYRQLAPVDRVEQAVLLADRHGDLGPPAG